MINTCSNATMPFFNSLKNISILRVISTPRNIHFKMRYLLVMNFEEVRLNDDNYYLYKNICCNNMQSISKYFSTICVFTLKRHFTIFIQILKDVVFFFNFEFSVSEIHLI